ncbi:major facilitator MFS-1 [Dacryopinax primogenitus]|uniref:Major facilitator MFS-1 n=1 Tax=Dacryopinax primogenitus (strain DJM 731) TaxID=1858805 RepID=M5FWU7_DACPD|nr:major facilitator MFS-1 [Dacryopinax primogenitus]EJU02446.1 major facilitator MFS-1 [Dacryopinax primogenitus]
MSGRRRISDARKFARDEEIQQLIDAEPDLPPPVPTVRKDASSAPLPILPMLVLAIAMLGEFLSANVSTPFLLFMVESFGVADDEAQVGYLTGVLASMFFITQFFTSLLWSTVANRHGARAVLFVSLLGNAITCVIFGTSRSYSEAIVIRLTQGVFNGAVGVARGTVATITTPDNEGRAYAILGFCWGMGGVTGAILGGSLESPALKFGGRFDTPFWHSYPYLLPAAIASCVTLTGAFLSLFLAWDGGPRNGAIRLPEKNPDEAEHEPAPNLPTMHEEDEESAIGVEPAPVPAPEEMQPEPPEQPNTIVTQLQNRVTKRLSGYFARRVREHQTLASSPGNTPPSNGPRQIHRSVSGPVPRARAGSAYGYGSRNLPSGLNGLRSRHASIQTIRRRRSSVYGGDDAYTDDQPTQNLSLAQRLLMANEFTVTSMGDLWVAAALNTEAEQVVDDTPVASDNEEENVNADAPESMLTTGQTSPNRRRFSQANLRAPEPSNGVTFSRFSTFQSFTSSDSPRENRRLSFASTLPPIMNNTGLAEPPGVLLSSREMTVESGLEPIVEGHVSHEEQQSQSVEIAPSSNLWSSLPLVIIFQYGLLALHSTTHDQVFYSYLVSQYKSGGLGLNPAGFAQLIALMSIAQMIFQFLLYPSVGPPRGRFSHLAMFRIGSLLFIPAYLSVIPYRLFTNAEGGGYVIVMIGLAISTATRYCGSTFCYTAVAILLNYMSPPPVVGLANGLAQSVVSLSRFIGPILGGYIWSVSVQDHASGYTFGFFIVSMICGLAILHSMTIR